MQTRGIGNYREKSTINRRQKEEKILLTNKLALPLHIILFNVHISISDRLIMNANTIEIGL